MMPTKADFDNLMAKTGEYVGYYQDGCNIIVAAFVLVSVMGGLISVRVVSRIDPVEAIS